MSIFKKLFNHDKEKGQAREGKLDHKPGEPIWQNVTVNCPTCGKKIPYKEYNFISAKRSPELADKVKNGELFSVKCSECGTVTNWAHVLVYSNIDNLYQISLAPNEGDRQQAIRGFGSVDNQMLVKGAGYRLRIVSTVDDLREKTNIFDAGLDDRCIEIIKWLDLGALEVNGVPTHPGKKADNLIFVSDKNGKNYFLMYGNHEFLGSLILTPENYNKQLKIYKKYFPEYNEYFIDKNWVNKLMKDNEEDIIREIKNSQ